MQLDILSILFMFGAALPFGIPLGKYMARVYAGEKTLLDPVMNPLEKYSTDSAGSTPTGR